MRNYIGGSLAAAALLFAAFSSSPSYQLQSYGINGAASNSAASASYRLESATGQVQSGTSTSTTYSGKSGSIQAQQASVPPAPMLSNGNATYYNKLGLILATGGNPSDTVYAVAISPNSFATTYYVQADGSLSTTPLFQTYTQWGGSSGTTIINLTSGTTYQVKVSAMQGTFTNTAYGPIAMSTTASPSLSFSISPSSITIPSLLSGTVVTSSAMTSGFATNANYGGSIYVADSTAGLRSASRSVTISSVSTTLSSATHGYGIRGSTVSQTSGGPLSIISPFAGASGVVGALNTTPQIIFTATTAIVGGSATAVLQAKAASTDPAASDYADVITFTAAASF
jgi:hypothetical protein